MAHYAEINQDNVVLRVVVVNDECEGSGTDAEKDVIGASWCAEFFGGGTWKKTSYTGNYRGQFAGIGFVYDPVLDEFVAPEEE